MARKGVTFDQVANAAATIKARGTEPTIAAIRVELGNEGSYSTISQHLAKWRTEDSEKGVHKEMPPEVENLLDVGFARHVLAVFVRLAEGPSAVVAVLAVNFALHVFHVVPLCVAGGVRPPSGTRLA